MFNGLTNGPFKPFKMAPSHRICYGGHGGGYSGAIFAALKYILIIFDVN